MKKPTRKLYRTYTAFFNGNDYEFTFKTIAECPEIGKSSVLEFFRFNKPVSYYYTLLAYLSGSCSCSCIIRSNDDLQALQLTLHKDRYNNIIIREYYYGA